jgi:hypothetical protein
LVLVETSVFTRQVRAALTDDVYRQLQVALVERPDLGARIPGSGGLRYPKNVQGDLSAQQLRVLRRIVEEEYP